MSRRYSFLFAALLGMVAAMVLLVGIVVATPVQQPTLPPKPTVVVLPTPSDTPLPIVTPTPTPGPAGDNPDATIAPFGDG
jgi:hypothetical protein